MGDDGFDGLNGFVALGADVPMTEGDGTIGLGFWGLVLVGLCVGTTVVLRSGSGFSGGSSGTCSSCAGGTQLGGPGEASGAGDTSLAFTAAGSGSSGGFGTSAAVASSMGFVRVASEDSVQH